MAALLTSEQDNTDKIVKYVDEVKRLGIQLLPPDVNRSIIEFSATTLDNEDVILFGLGAVKGLGKSAVQPILEARKEGMFKDMNDFIARINGGKVNKKAYESLIKSGAFDRFEYNRRTMLDQIETIVATASTANKLKADATNSLFGDDESMTSVELKLNHYEEFDLKTILEFEKATLGFYVSGHPLDEFRDQLDAIEYTLSSDLENIADGQKALFVGKVEEIVHKVSKKGNKFGILHLMDLHGELELMLFSDFLEKLESMDLDKPIAIKTTITKDDQFTRIKVDKIMDLKEAKKAKIQTKKVELPPEPVTVEIELNHDTSIIEKLHGVAKDHHGNRPLDLVIKSKLANVVMQTNIKVSDLFVDEIRKNYANEYIVV
jgi:DNA polymerase-3 subunit alpha